MPTFLSALGTIRDNRMFCFDGSQRIYTDSRGVSVFFSPPRVLLDHGVNQANEQRMRIVGPRLQFRMELRSQKIWVVRQLYHFYEFAVWRNATEGKPCFGQLISKVVVYFIPVSVALPDYRLAIDLGCLGAQFEIAGIATQSHRAAFQRDIMLIRHEIDHRIWSVRVEFCRMRFLHAGHVSCEIYNGDLHTKAQPKIRHSMSPGVGTSLNLAFDTAVTKAAWHNNTIDIGKIFSSAVFFDVFRKNPLYIDGGS